jgi:hypothetical protein
MVKPKSLIVPTQVALLSLASFTPCCVSASSSDYIWNRIRTAMSGVTGGSSQQSLGDVAAVNGSGAVQRPSTGAAVTSLLPTVTRTTIHITTSTPMRLPPPELFVYDDEEEEMVEREEMARLEEEENVSPASPLYRRTAPSRLKSSKREATPIKKVQKRQGNSGIGDSGGGNSGNYDCGYGKEVSIYHYFIVCYEYITKNGDSGEECENIDWLT